VGEYQKAGVMAGLRRSAAAAADGGNAQQVHGGGPGNGSGLNAVGCSFEQYKFTLEEDF